MAERGHSRWSPSRPPSRRASRLRRARGVEGARPPRPRYHPGAPHAAHDFDGKILRVRMIMKEGVENFDAPYLFDEGSTISWIPAAASSRAPTPASSSSTARIPSAEEAFRARARRLSSTSPRSSSTSSRTSPTARRTKFYGEITPQIAQVPERRRRGGTGLPDALRPQGARAYRLLAETEIVGRRRKPFFERDEGVKRFSAGKRWRCSGLGCVVDLEWGAVVCARRSQPV